MSDFIESKVSRTLAEHAAGFSYDDMPPELIRVTKDCIIDTLGVIIAASSLGEEAQGIYAVVDDFGGAEQSTVMGSWKKTSAPWAAFTNGSLGHMIDYDDVSAGGHIGITIVPPTLALAERSKTTTGKELLASVATGIDIQVRLGMSYTDPGWLFSEYWFISQVLGTIAGAAACGQILRLDADRIQNAMGLALQQTAGSRQMVIGGSSQARSLQAGFTSLGSVISALLAQRGITGPLESVEGQYGLYRNYARAEPPDWEMIVRNLGTSFPVVQSRGVKVWPSCGITRSPIAATLEIMRDNNLSKENIRQIKVTGGNLVEALCTPIEAKRHPTAVIDAKYSIPFTVAHAIVHGNVLLQSFSPAGLADPEVLEIAKRVDFIKQDAASIADKEVAVVEIVTNDGASYRAQVSDVPGSPNAPVDQPAVHEKFLDCLQFASSPISDAQAREALDLIEHFEDVAAVAELTRVLSRQGAPSAS